MLATMQPQVAAAYARLAAMLLLVVLHVRSALLVPTPLLSGLSPVPRVRTARLASTSLAWAWPPHPAHCVHLACIPPPQAPQLWLRVRTAPLAPTLLAWAWLQQVAARAVALDCTPPPQAPQLVPPAKVVLLVHMAQAWAWPQQAAACCVA